MQINSYHASLATTEIITINCYANAEISCDNWARIANGGSGITSISLSLLKFKGTLL